MYTIPRCTENSLYFNPTVILTSGTTTVSGWNFWNFVNYSKTILLTCPSQLLLLKELKQNDIKQKEFLQVDTRYILENEPGKSIIKKFGEQQNKSIETATELCMKAIEVMGKKTSIHHGPTHHKSEAHKDIPEDISIMHWFLRYGLYNDKSLHIFRRWLQTYTTSKYKQLKTNETIYID